MKKLFQNKYLVGIFSILLIGILAISINILGEDKVIAENISEDISIKEEIKEESIPKEFYVDVKGSVKRPGVYKVEDGMIVADAIKLAGGVNSKANTNNINLSKKLSSEMVIYVYSKSEINKLTQKNEIPCICEIIDVDNSLQTDSSNDSVSSNKKININTASKEELMSIKGIGEAKADAIIDYRSNNHFESIEDIKEISGIGDAMFDKIKDFITV